MDTDTLGKFLLFIIVLAVIVSFILMLLGNSENLALSVLKFPF